MAKIFLYLAYLIIVCMSVYFIYTFINRVFNKSSNDSTDKNYEIGERGNVNDIEKYGNKTVHTMDVGNGYLAFVLLQDEFWYSVVEEDTEEAAIFPSKEKAQTEAAKLLATEGSPVILEDDSKELDWMNESRRDISNEKRSVQRNINNV